MQRGVWWFVFRIAWIESGPWPTELESFVTSQNCTSVASYELHEKDLTHIVTGARSPRKFMSSISVTQCTLLAKKGCYTPIEDDKTNVDRTFVFPFGWNWHDMDPWLFPNEIRHYLGQTFNARSSGIVELRKHRIGGRFPESIFTLWQLWINICIFFQKLFWLFEQCPVQPLWVLVMRCLHLPVKALSKVLLLPVWVWLPSTAYSKGMLPLDLWCQASLQGLPERQHLGKTVHCWGWSDRIVSWVLGPWRRGWEICTEWGLVVQRLTTDSSPVVTGRIDPQRSPCWLPTTVVSAWSGRRGGGTWQWPTGSMSSSVMSRDSNFTR